MDSRERDAKMGVLKEIRQMAMDHMGNDQQGFKKVSVAANDKKGLEEGLDKAKEMVGRPEEEIVGGENPDLLHEHPRSSADAIGKEIAEDADEGELSPEDIDQLIATLQAKKAELSSKQPE